MNKQELTKLRDKLPHRYASLISKKLENISAVQVQLVFNGIITDPDKVEAVINEANNLFDRMKNMQSSISERVEENELEQ